MGLKRTLANLLGEATGTVIAAKWELHQLPEREHLKKFFEHFGVDCVFDVGANEGQYAERLRDAVGFTGAIISYEPIPELAAQLRRKAARDPNWHVVEAALDRTGGTARFNVMAGMDFSSLHTPAADQIQMIADLNSVARVIEVQRTTLADEFARWRDELGFQRPFLKLDTQGNDVPVVESAGALISEFVGLQSELSIRPIYDGSAGFVEALDTYRQAGFELSALVPNTAGHFPVLLEMDCIMYRPGVAPDRLAPV
jgi:FkbM family methyltransferase